MRQSYKQRRPAFMLLFGLLLALLNTFIGSSYAQISGTELCACSPRVYELTFDFSLECEPINVDLEGGGIADATCLVTGFDDINVTDLVPVAVSSVQLIEIGQDGGPAAVAQETGDFRDGSTVTYTSISFEGAVAPRAFQVRALGTNQAGEPLVLQWAVTYSNNCGVFPVLEVNDSIGWTIFTGLARPIALVCPAAAIPTNSPTVPPTLIPTLTPTTETPTGPLIVETPFPTKVPTASPTEVPTAEPSVPPSEPPTNEPTIPPGIPSASPTTEAPTVLEMSFSYSFSYDVDDLEMDSADMEFGREDKPPCRKKKVRRVRKVRKLRANAAAGIGPMLERTVKTGGKKKEPRDGNEDNSTKPVGVNVEGNLTAAEFDGVAQGDDLWTSGEDIDVFGSGDEVVIAMTWTDAPENIEASGDPGPMDDEYEYVEEYVDVEVCEHDPVTRGKLQKSGYKGSRERGGNGGQGGNGDSSSDASSGKESSFSEDEGGTEDSTSGKGKGGPKDITKGKGTSLKDKDANYGSKKSFKSSGKGSGGKGNPKDIPKGKGKGTGGPKDIPKGKGNGGPKDIPKGKGMSLKDKPDNDGSKKSPKSSSKGSDGKGSSSKGADGKGSSKGSSSKGTDGKGASTSKGSDLPKKSKLTSGKGMIQVSKGSYIGEGYSQDEFYSGDIESNGSSKGSGKGEGSSSKGDSSGGKGYDMLSKKAKSSKTMSKMSRLRPQLLRVRY